MANNRKKNSPAGIIFALLMLIVIVIALVIVLRSCSATDDGGDSTTPPVQTGEVSNAPVTTPGSGSAAPSTPSTAPSAAPTPTATPEPTPSPTPAPPAIESSGSFRSDTGTSLNIRVDWQISGSGSNATLLATVYAESYSLFSQGAWHAGCLTINGQDYYFDTEAIEYEGPGQGTNLLGTVTAPVDTASLPTSATLTWHFQGTYGDTELENIVATGTIGR